MEIKLKGKKEEVLELEICEENNYFTVQIDGNIVVTIYKNGKDFYTYNEKIKSLGFKNIN